MQNSSAPDWLIIQLRPRLWVSFVEEEPRATLTADGQQYYAIADGKVQLAFDRLVGSDGRFIGIQMWVCLDEAWQIMRSLDPDPRLDVTEQPPIVGVFFAPRSSFDDQEIRGTGEQSLIGQVYTNTAQAVVVSVDLSELLTEDSEKEVIRAAQRRWVNEHA